jgi:hypothetical protein
MGDHCTGADTRPEVNENKLIRSIPAQSAVLKCNPDEYRQRFAEWLKLNIFDEWTVSKYSSPEPWSSITFENVWNFLIEATRA